MTDRQLEQRLRTWYRAQLEADQQPSVNLAARILAIPETATVRRSLAERLGLPRSWALAAALLLLLTLLIGSMIAVGSGLVELPWQVREERLLPAPGRLALQREGIVTINPDGSGLRSVAEEPEENADRWPAWSPDGKRLAFARYQEVLVADYPSFEIRSSRMAHEPLDGLAWSPDGTQLALWSPDALVVVRPDGTGRRTVFYARGYFDLNGAVSWSPDGTRFLTSTSMGALVLIDAADGTVTTLLEADPPSRDPTQMYHSSRGSWSPDGLQVAFTGRDKIEVINIDGSGRRALHPGRTPIWSPDGSLIAFFWEKHGIHVIRPDGEGLRFVGHGWHPSWSPDGMSIVYCGTAGDESGIYIAQADAGEPQFVTPHYCGWFGVAVGTVSWQSLPR
jgi:WD40 repeat protein